MKEREITKNVLLAMLRRAESDGLNELKAEIYKYAEYCNISLEEVRA